MLAPPSADPSTIQGLVEWCKELETPEAAGPMAAELIQRGDSEDDVIRRFCQAMRNDRAAFGDTFRWLRYPWIQPPPEGMITHVIRATVWVGMNTVMGQLVLDKLKTEILI